MKPCCHQPQNTLEERRKYNPLMMIEIVYLCDKRKELRQYTNKDFRIKYQTTKQGFEEEDTTCIGKWIVELFLNL
ncbi:hypothetical protein DPMN_040724 [Dreissena polymorpha]|uniref:Uncharacterized protein n=1 Tax=Dreissena polymorpha TaxID=45954 RepID=A0A9D4CXR6_DREPO|nr:hypothetical protein DPMN_040724 [Dreissena polymorpha]